MAKEVQHRRGTTAEHSSFTGAVGEITVDSDKDVVVVHDGSTAGGFPLAKETSLNNKNVIINGNFDIWQRGTSFTPSASATDYTADRFAVIRATNANYTVARQGSLGGYSIRLQRDSGTSDTNAIKLAQAIESENSVWLAGKTVTLSFDIKVGADFSAASDTVFCQIRTGTGTNESVSSMISGSWTGANTDSQANASLTTSFVRKSFTVTLGSNITQLGIMFTATSIGTASTNDWYEIQDIQLEIGSVATEFERRSIATELAMCQRYYRLTTGAVTTLGFAFSGTQIRWLNNWMDNPMRATPSIGTPSTVTAHRSNVANNTFTSTSSITGESFNSKGGSLLQGGYTGLTSGEPHGFLNSIITYDAEL